MSDTAARQKGAAHDAGSPAEAAGVLGEHMEPVKPPKKRRLRGACDICRRQKIRCDSAKMPGSRCSNCVAFNSECTHNLSQHKEKGPRRKRTINAQPQPVGVETRDVSTRVLETAKNVVDGLLRQTSTFQAPEDREALLQLLVEVAHYARSLEQELDTHRSQTSPSDQASNNSVSPQADAQDTEVESGIVIDFKKLPEHMRRITMDTANHRFFGKNSSINFLKTAIEGVRQEAIFIPRSTRPEFWARQPWEAHPEAPAPQIFPPEDLLWDLIEIYFAQLNIWSFIVHRPTFEKSISDGLHLRDHRFGATVLAVCALASKNSPDPRVLLDTYGGMSAGWKWFQQIRRPFSGPVVETASLYELQLCCLYLMYQQTGSNVESCWLLSGIGILQAQDIGVHRRPDGKGPLDLQDEMLKRCFYFLAMFDAVISACFGRLRVSKASEFDLGLPVARDDESLGLEDPGRAFKQPLGKPSLMDFNVAYIKLIKIFTFGWRKSGPLPNYTSPLEADVISELDARLNKWAEEIPEHLLWNPYMEDDTFFDQSAALYAAYYHIQILVHRPFIPAQPPTASAFKSLAICTNAARSCSHVVDVKSRRGFSPGSHTLKAAFESAIVIILSISGCARSGLSIDVGRELVDVYKCMMFLRQSEGRWQNAGRYYDMLCELLTTSNLPVPSDEGLSAPWISKSYNRKPVPEIQVADLRAQNPELWPEHFFSLPMAAEDLGCLPIYGSLESTEMDMDIFEKFVPDITAAATVTSVDSLQLSSTMGYPVLDYSSNVPGPSYDPHAMDMDPYLSHWMPYFSNVDGMTQIIQNQNQNATVGNYGRA
ncbi:fungal-specific transcription factor domain-containing protein [Mycena rosella]|uniref:Fungal-specific transcription factor domain-containing protein n=1 Tax=Mycena rosella TaxID=1033263 RepID=A0AAD7CTM6_MYCRO|nr:fungal-specific transcription factor domain-containing protein [Mycena rosella]